MSTAFPMNIFNRKKRFLIVLIILILGMICLQILYKKTKKPHINQHSFFLFSEIQTMSVNLHNGVSDLMKKYIFLLNLNEKNKQLMMQNNKLKAQQQRFGEILKENERLKKLIHFPLNKGLTLLPAQVVGTDFLSKNELLTINKGSQHGVKKSMGVLHPDGVIGYIFRVSPNSSQVISLLSPLSSLPARNSRSRWAGLIEGYSTDLLLFNYLDKEKSDTELSNTNYKHLKPGDKIVTIKSEQFPSGLLVGHILSLKQPSKDLNPKIYIRPVVKFHSLEEVLVILGFTKNQPQKQNLQQQKSLQRGNQNNETKI